mmetsp:Transcript_19700/g.60934  ORF Transcript_19700/g.60934 Transcript_19700/m.60934 type:complete len:236 (+) Transcript_19700:2313-3020(+)
MTSFSTRFGAHSSRTPCSSFVKGSTVGWSSSQYSRASLSKERPDCVNRKTGSAMISSVMGHRNWSGTTGGLRCCAFTLMDPTRRRRLLWVSTTAAVPSSSCADASASSTLRRLHASSSARSSVERGGVSTARWLSAILRSCARASPAFVATPAATSLSATTNLGSSSRADVEEEEAAERSKKRPLRGMRTLRISSPSLSWTLAKAWAISSSSSEASPVAASPSLTASVALRAAST